MVFNDVHKPMLFGDSPRPSTIQPMFEPVAAVAPVLGYDAVKDEERY